MRSTLRRQAPFVGRREQLSILGDALRADGPRVVIVEGPAGIGKTSLVERLLDEHDDLVAVVAGGEESERHIAFGVADQLLRRAGGGAGALNASDHVAVGLEVLALASSPTVLVVDDAHWADESSLRSLLFAARRLVAEAVAIVLVTRDATALPEGLRKLASTTVRLEPLDLQELVELAEAVQSPLGHHALRRLGEHTGGHPLYARVLLEEVPDEAWSDPDRVLPVPRSYADVVIARLERCEPAGRALVEAAAVLGRSCALGDAAQIAGLTDPLEAFDAAAGVLLPDEDDSHRRVRFAHPLDRAAVYAHLTAVRRSALHRAASAIATSERAALQHRVEATTTTDARLADEAEAFAVREQARGAWESAIWGQRAASQLSPAPPQRERRMLAAIEAMLYGGDGDGARQVFEAAGPFADSAQLETVRAYLAIYAGDVEEAEMRLARAWEQLDPATDRAAAAGVASRRAFVSNLNFRARDVVAWATRAVELAPEDERTCALSSTQKAVGLLLQRRRDEAHAEIDRALERAPSSGFPARSIKGAMLLGDDDLAAARPVLRAAAAEAQEIGSLVIASQSLALLAKLEFAAGAWDESTVLAQRAVALATETGEAWAQAFADWASLHVGLARGERRTPAPLRHRFARIVEVHALAQAEAATTADDVFNALTPLTTLPDGYWRWQPLYADALVDRGRLDEAVAFLDEHDRRWTRSTQARLDRARGRVEAQRDHDAAEAAFTRSVHTLAALRMPYEQALSELAFGQFLRRRRRRTEATLLLKAARSRLAPLAATPALERCERELGAVGHRQPRRPDGPELTPQERTVAQLVARGKTNREVADELLVSVRTVEAHLTRIYAKVGVNTRAALAARLARD